MKNCGGHDGLELLAASAKMDSPFLRRSDEYSYQRRLALMLAAVRQRPEIRTVLSSDLMTLSEDFGPLCHTDNR